MLPIPPHTQALLFDCDGTLADTMQLHYEAWRDLLAEKGIDFPREFIDKYAGRPTVEITRLVNQQWGINLEPDATANDKEARFEAKLHRATPIEPVVATARYYHGKMPMGVVSGGIRQHVAATLEAIGLGDLFPVLVTADDPVAPKPSPEIFLAAARQLGVPPQRCHVFEDGDSGIVAAREAGMTVTDVRPLVAG